MAVPVPEVSAAKAFSLFTEFKNFLFKGNLIDMAVGIIMGGAFGKLVDVFVKSVALPFVQAIAAYGTTPDKQKEIEKLLNRDWNGQTIGMGTFLGELTSFIILGAVVFFVIVKVIGAIMKKKEEAPAAPPAPSKEEVLLTEIRDLLAKR